MAELELAYVPGVMPGKWVRRFEESHPQDKLHARPLSQGEDPLEELRAGRARLVLLRYPEDSSPAHPGLHVIPLYTERPVVVAPRDHDVEYFDEDAEISAEDAQLWPRLDLQDFPEDQGGVAMLVEVVAAGDRTVAVLPQSLARMHSRKDTVWRYVAGESSTMVGLAWLRVQPHLSDDAQPLALAAANDPLVEELIGVVRGRRPGSSRQPSVREREQAAKQRKQEKKAKDKAKRAAAKAQSNAQGNKERNHGKATGRRPTGSRGGSTGARGRGRGGPRR